jgi:CHAT domain-containing protein/Tfp pilus assembly protein PilF
VSPTWVAEADSISPDQLVQHGQAAFQKGSFPQAVLDWTEAARLYERDGKLREQVQTLIQLSEALQRVGRYRDAAASLRTALAIVEQQGDAPRRAAILGRLGNLASLIGQDEEAESLFQEALKIARETDRKVLTASLLNDLGNLLAATGRHTEAIAAYSESAGLAKGAGHELLRATSTINAARASIQKGSRIEGKALLDSVPGWLAGLDDSHDKAYAWLTFGLTYEALRGPDRQGVVSRFDEEGQASEAGSRKIVVQPPEPTISEPAPLAESHEAQMPSKDDVVRASAQAYWAAHKVALAIGDAPAESYAWGYLGHLYEKEGRIGEALDLTRRAVAAAQKTRTPEALYRWHWQTARLLSKQGKEDEAIAAYRRAIETLQPIRQEFLVGSRNRITSFRETTGPLFFELSDLLLRRAASTTDRRVHRELLTQAQDTIELFKAAELQDYFNDECVAMARSRSTAVAESAKNTAVLYPIVLPDRLELLVSLPAGLQQVVVPVEAEKLTESVRAFRLALEGRGQSAYLTHARQLYDWLIQPIDAELQKAGITTLVFVPDGPLRTIPMAPLFDGTNFLIARYAMAVVPGLTLTDARPIDRAHTTVLSAGLSDSVQGFPPLPNVTRELRSIQQLYGGVSLLNTQFKVLNVQSRLKEQPFTILHIASHGTVGKDVKQSFILAYDDKITMDRLADLVGLMQFRESPLELLTLSACETAAGDDRAALGLAGVAIKAGARSALATLWQVDDAATSELVEEFYQQLRDPSVSKATALQRAQMKILKEPERAHPSYWAPFLLINNWL